MRRCCAHRIAGMECHVWFLASREDAQPNGGTVTEQSDYKD